MNEVLIKNIINYKFSTVEKILDKLPPEISNSFKSLGAIVLESVNENSQKIKDQSVNKATTSEKLNKVKIE